METNHRCCPNSDCSDAGKISHGNVKVYSHQEQRYYGTTCGQRFRQSRSTLFYKLRTPRQDFIEAVGRLAERCSLRAIARIKHAKLATLLPWLELAGAQAATVSQQLTRNLSLTQVQIDELWTFVKKSLVISTRTNHARESATIGFGQPSRSPRRLRITSYLSQERSEVSATIFIQPRRACSDGQAPFFTSDKLPA